VQGGGRREKVEKELCCVRKQATTKVHEDAGLLKLVSYLNEYRRSLKKIRSSFLSLPGRILITVMRGHQKYFAVEKRGGSWRQVSLL